MAAFDEAKHPRDEDGKWTSTGSARQPRAKMIAGTVGSIAGSLAGGWAADRLAGAAINAAITRFKIAGPSAAVRYGIPALRFAARFALGSAAAGPVGAIGTALGVAGVGAYYGFREWSSSRATKADGPMTFRQIISPER